MGGYILELSRNFAKICVARATYRRHKSRRKSQVCSTDNPRRANNLCRSTQTFHRPSSLSVDRPSTISTMKLSLRNPPSLSPSALLLASFYSLSSWILITIKPLSAASRGAACRCKPPPLSGDAMILQSRRRRRRRRHRTLAIIAAKDTTTSSLFEDMRHARHLMRG